MTEQEAKDWLKAISATQNQSINKSSLSDRKEALYMAMRAIDKQIPKKVYHFIDDDTFETSCCGTNVTNKDYKYCPECGQFLGEIEEVMGDEYDRE